MGQEQSGYAPQEAAKPVESLHTPYYHALQQEAAKSSAFREKPEAVGQLQRAFTAIDAQQLANLRVHASQNERFASEGSSVQLPYTQIRITPHMLEYIAHGGKYEPEPLPEGKIKSDTTTYIIFPAFAAPNDTVFSAGDATCDRVMRLLGHAVRHPGKDIRVIVVGSPLALGGKVTKPFVDAVDTSRSLAPYGEVSAELLTELLPAEITDDTRIVLQGVSKGTQIAIHTDENLPAKYHTATKLREGNVSQAAVQRLMDIPPVPHQTEKQGKLTNSLKIIGGLGAEYLMRLRDPITKVLTKQGKSFAEALAKENTDMASDSSEQSKLKWSALLSAERKGIIHDTLKGNQVRSFIKRGIDDPLTGTRGQNREIGREIDEATIRKGERLTTVRQDWQKRIGALPEGAEKEAAKQRAEEEFQAILRSDVIPVFDEGEAHSLYMPIQGRHFYDTYTHFARWAKMLAYVGKKQTA